MCSDMKGADSSMAELLSNIRQNGEAGNGIIHLGNSRGNG